jgi:hypothetical protein
MRRALTTLVLALLALVVLPSVAQADAETGPSRSSGSASFSTDEGGRSSGSGYDWPEVVVGGNALSFQAPLQFGIVNYLPKARFAFQYDRQLRKGHWVHVGLAILADRGDWRNFRMDSCGFTAAGQCEAGGVVGFDLYAGYSYKWYLRERPWLVPIARGSVSYSYFALPNVRGGDATREQIRTHTTAITIKPGGGFRIFLLNVLSVGSDINLPLGLLVFREVPDGGSRERSAGFLFGIEVLQIGRAHV